MIDPPLLMSLLLAVVALSASATNRSIDRLTPCVGSQLVALQERSSARQPSQAPSAMCLANKSVSVCRTLLDGEQTDNRTMRVTVSIHGAITQNWLESADPAQLRQFHAFVNKASQASPLIVIATQQSESQGMGAQEWQINAITPSGRHAFTTSEFGPLGGLVFERGQRIPACKLLWTRWESRQTQAGDRLFLVGGLINFDAISEDAKGTPIVATRFNQRLERLRLTHPEQAPLVYFRAPKPLFR